MTTALEEKTSSETDLVLQLEQIVRGAISANKSFAFWKNQGSSTLHGLVSLADSVSSGKHNLEETSPGFLISPFKNETRHKEIKISADIIFRQLEENQLLFAPFSNARNDAAEKLLRRFDSDELFRKDIQPYFPRQTASGKKYSDDYRAIVAEAVSRIKSGEFDKVVPSRFIEVPYPQEWDFVKVFEEMCAAYNDAFVYVFGIPGIGTWMGATPELLLSIVNKRWFKSVALAGTQRIPSTGNLSEIAWTQKEIEEQALVSRYIINCFKKIRVREYEEKGPKTSRAGNLAHLKTEFHVDMEEVNFPQLGTVMLELLHPTSAVCGMPLEPSFQFIEKTEGYDREFFTGYLGPVNLDDKTQLYVNLRSMKLLPDRARLYAGAGVTEDSQPDKEWEETELKIRTMKRLFEQA